MIYKFEAEHIDRKTAHKFVRKLEDEGVEVEYAQVGRIFENQMTMIITAEHKDVEAVRARIWDLNHGAYCDMAIITEDQLEAYF